MLRPDGRQRVGKRWAPQRRISRESRSAAGATGSGRGRRCRRRGAGRRPRIGRPGRRSARRTRRAGGAVGRPGRRRSAGRTLGRTGTAAAVGLVEPATLERHTHRGEHLLHRHRLAGRGMHGFGERVVGERLLDLDGLAGVDELVDVRGHRCSAGRDGRCVPVGAVDGVSSRTARVPRVSPVDAGGTS